MAEKFGGNLISKGKNELATGGGAENLPEATQEKMYQSVVISVYISGDNLNQIDFLSALQPGDGESYTITKMDVKWYYGSSNNSTK